MELCEYMPNSDKSANDLLDRVIRCSSGHRDSQDLGPQSFSLNAENRAVRPLGVVASRESDSIWNCCYGQHTVHSSISAIIWELNRNCDGLRTLRLNHDDISHLSQVLNAASRYELELQDVG